MENKKLRRGRCFNLVTEDLITDIISRLPAKDLMRFTCVSNSWCSLIRTDPFFHRLQKERNASPDRPFLLVEKLVRSPSGSYATSWSHYNYLIDVDLIQAERSVELTEIHNPFNEFPGDARVVGSCHGLLILQQQPSLKMALTNPTTRTHRLLPPNPAGEANVDICGLGYDRAHDCFKLVTKVCRQREIELFIYNVNSDTWYQFENKNHFPGFQCYKMKCVDGVVYWCLDLPRGGVPREIQKIICFVLSEEEFHEVETPDFGEVKYNSNLTVLDGRLGLVLEGLNGAMHEVWTLDMVYDSNKACSWRWTKILSLSCPKATLPPPYYLKENLLMIPQCFSACKTKILYDMQQSDLFWYDMGSKVFRKLDEDPIKSVRRIFKSFSPSLLGIGISDHCNSPAGDAPKCTSAGPS